MHNFFVKRQYLKQVKSLLRDTPYDGTRVVQTTSDQITILTEKQVKILINLGLDLNEICFKVPYTFKKGDYVTCIEGTTCDLSDWNERTVNHTRIATAWKKNKTFQVHRTGAGGAILFADAWVGLYLNWVRPATEKEIADFKARKEQEQLKFPF